MTGRDPMFGRPAARPYAGGTGSSGSVASHERRETEDESGVSGFRQTMVLGHLQQAGAAGLTWVELQQRLGGDWHHGHVTGALSNMHKANLIARLTERRPNPRALLLEETEDGGRHSTSSVYVAKEFILGRPTAKQGGKRTRLEAHVDALEERLATLTADIQRLTLEVTPLEVERDVLREQVATLEQHAAGMKAEIEGWENRLERAHLRVAALERDLSAANTNYYKAVEVLDRYTDDRQLAENRLRTEHEEQVTRLQNEVARSANENAALRMQRWLAALEVDEQVVLDAVVGKLQQMPDAPDSKVAPVSLRALRIMTQALSRLERKERHERG